MFLTSPACRCCEDCEIYTQDFSVDTDGVTVDSGTWTRVQNSGIWSYECTAAGAIVTDVENTGGTNWVQLDVRFSAVDQVIKVHLWSDSSVTASEYEVRVTSKGSGGTDCAELEIYDGVTKVSGTEFYYGEAPGLVIPDVTLNLVICYDTTRILAGIGTTPTAKWSIAAEVSLPGSFDSFLAVYADPLAGNVRIEKIEWQHETVGGAQCKVCDTCNGPFHDFAAFPILAGRACQTSTSTSGGFVTYAPLCVHLDEYDRTNGYTINAAFGNSASHAYSAFLTVWTLDLDGTHRVEFDFDATSPDPTGRIVLYRGATELARVEDTFVDIGFPHFLYVTHLRASLRDDDIVGRMDVAASNDDPTKFKSFGVVSTTTTTYNGPDCSVKLPSPNSTTPVWRIYRCYDLPP